MKARILLLLIPAFLLPCCEERAETFHLTVTVKDDNWTHPETFGSPLPDATVNVYRLLNDQTNIDLIEISALPDYKGTTSQTGEISFNVLIAGEYFIIVNKNNLSNVILPETVNGKTVGYIISGLFQNQAEVDDAAYQPNAAVGEVRFMDLNGDGAINAGDRHIGSQLNITGETDVTIWVAEKNADPFI